MWIASVADTGSKAVWRLIMPIAGAAMKDAVMTIVVVVTKTVVVAMKAVIAVMKGAAMKAGAIAGAVYDDRGSFTCTVAYGRVQDINVRGV